MATISVDVLNPKAFTLLEDLATLQLISIRKEAEATNDFMSLVQQIRSKSFNLPTLDEITAEVEQQRTEMYALAQ
jgi:hypothetical protein